MPALTESYESLFVGSMDWRRGFGFGRFAVDNTWTNSMRESVTAIASEYMQAPSWKSHVVIQPKLFSNGQKDSAFSVMGNTYIGLYSVWDEVQDDQQNMEWLGRMAAKLDTYAVGHYANEIDAANDIPRLKRCFSVDAWERLRSIREKWDPQHILHDFPGLS